MKDAAQTLSDKNSARLAGVVFASVVAIVAVLRLYYCAHLPASTGDIARNLVYGLYAIEHGLATAGRTLEGLDRELEWICWSDRRYNYPVVALGFFGCVAGIWPTIFFAKLALTLIEALNSFLIWRYSRHRLLALMYWASPISIWWVSREGQFEPLQNLFVIASLCLLAKRPRLALCLLALGVQAKVTAVLLLPYFLMTVYKRGQREFWASSAAFALGFLPSVIASLYYPVLRQVLLSGEIGRYNPHYIFPYFQGIIGANPVWLVAIYQCASHGVLIALLVLGLRSNEGERYVGPIAFLLFMKLSTLYQPWYTLVAVTFLLPIQSKWTRFALVACTLLFDLWAPMEVLGIPFGSRVGGYYRDLGVFDVLRI